jgi:hypothetical protein
MNIKRKNENSKDRQNKNRKHTQPSFGYCEKEKAVFWFVTVVPQHNCLCFRY